ncbi:MAG: CcoQ/FixQ family Cbb3-type cytochrome c oxidase assembly chaperone [Bacteriovoracaceae bacterium]|nr:CcoQ/FixQ family Cbb3-type cytochrome c oxidase assembly chaperone [Bacteriovoracaceae bacterium]
MSFNLLSVIQLKWFPAFSFFFFFLFFIGTLCFLLGKRKSRHFEKMSYLPLDEERNHV